MSQTTSLAIRLPEPLWKRLEALAQKTGRTKTFYATQAIASYLEEMEDVFIAVDRLEKPGQRYTLEEAKAALELDG